MQLYDQSSLDALHRMDHPTSHFFLPFFTQGVRSFITNVDTQLYLLEFKHHLIPLTLNNSEYDNSYIVSNYYPIARRCELQARQPFRRALTQLAGLGLKAIQINKVVSIGNWFLSTNPLPQLSTEELREITSFLGEKFPDHLLTVRSIQSGEIAPFNEVGYQIHKARDIYFYDSAKRDELSRKVRYKRRRDLKGLEKYELVQTVPRRDFASLISLYQQIYIEKHTRLSPHYTEQFLEQAVTHGLLSLTALKEEGRYVGVYGSWVREGKMAVPFFGYDQHLPRHQEIYCLLTTLILEEADAKGAWLNDGTGGDYAKEYRGFSKQPEYVGLYAKHLPLSRRWIWSCADYLTISPTKKR